jgi:hypothetical protein
LEIDIFLVAHELTKLNQKVINNLNRSIMSNEIKEVMKSLPKRKSSGLEEFLDEFSQTFKEELTSQAPTLRLQLTAVRMPQHFSNYSIK